jgi:hypothetical protein
MWHTPNAYTGPTQRHSLTRCSGNGPLRAGLERDSAIDIVWFFYRPRSLSTTRSRQAVESSPLRGVARTAFLDQLPPPPTTSPTTGAGR